MWPGIPGGAACTGTVAVRWYLADAGVRRSKIRRWESLPAADIMAGLEGQKEVLYVQLPTGKVAMESVLVGDH